LPYNHNQLVPRLSKLRKAFANRALNAYKRIIMPYVNIQITKGATRDQKAQLVKEVTDSLVRILGKKPEHTHIVIQEIEEEDWGFSGLLTDDWKKQQV
jgi:4-oxalocrotonate tautomerase